MISVIQGDALAMLREVASDSVQCCVTSPPSFGLRDYGVAGQIGLEATPAEFIARLVAVFSEVRRVLKKDGTLWVNMGDSYAGSGRGGYPGGKSGLEGSCDGQDQTRVARGSQIAAGFHEKIRQAGAVGRAWCPPPAGFKNKDLLGIPWMLAFALRADGWWLRSEIIWSKKNCMPESVADRPTRSHEHIFLLSKSVRYFYDASAIAEPQEEGERLRRLREQAEGLGTKYTLQRDQPHGQHAPGANGVARSVEARQRLAVKGTRNKRTVWSVATQPYAEAHFACYPPDLIKPCILAGSRPGDTVLDPFGGSGTTGQVALELGRGAILIELNPAYVGLIEKRTTTTMGLPLESGAAA